MVIKNQNNKFIVKVKVMDNQIKGKMTPEELIEALTDLKGHEEVTGCQIMTLTNQFVKLQTTPES